MPVQRLKMPQNLSVKAERICDIIGMYGAVDFADALSDFIAEVLNSTLPGHTTRYRGENVYLPFSQVPVFHSIKFIKCSNPERLEIVDAVHTWLEQRDSHGCTIPACFDTVLVKGREQTGQGSKGM